MSDHDDRRPADDDLDDAERALATRLTSALVGQAGTVVIAAEPFDATRPAMIDLADDHASPRATDAPVRGAADGTGGIEPTSGSDTLDPLPITALDRRRRGWSTWIAGVAAAAVLVAAIVMINAVRQPSVDTGNPLPLVGPDAAWAPSWVPDGLELWRVDASEGDADTVMASETGRPVDRPVVQLFEATADDTRVLVSMSTTDDLSASGGTPTTIRGAAGSTRPEEREAPGKPRETRFEWKEAGITFNALVAEPATTAAAALLEGLTFAVPDDPSKGFAAPADGAWTVRTDDPRSLADASVIVARFGYGSARPDGGGSSLEVLTFPAGPAASGFVGFLSTAFLGSIRADGAAVSFEPGDGDRPSQSFTVWPDGRTVYIQGINLDEATAARIADGVEPISREELQARIADVSIRLGTGDVVASADLPSGRVEVIGTPAANAVCLTVADQRTCTALSGYLNPAGQRGADSDMPLLGSILVDGRWLLVAAVDGGDVDFEVGAVLGGTSLETSIETVDGPPPGTGVTSTIDGVGTAIEDTEVVTAPVSGSGPSTTASGTGQAVATAEPTTGSSPPRSSSPFESSVVGSWTLALFVAPADAGTVTISTPGRSATYSRPTL